MTRAHAQRGRRFLAGSIRLLAALVLAALTGQAAAAAGGPGIQLEYWHSYSGRIGEMHARLVDEFNRSHPGVQVHASYSGTPWTMRDKLVAALTAGAGPDVASIDQFWISQLADGGYAVPAAAWIQADPAVDPADIAPVYWETARYQGRIWSMPFAVSHEVLYYNADLLARLGLADRAIPGSWDEFVAFGKEIQARAAEAGEDPVWVLDSPTTAQTGVVYPFLITLWQYGGRLFSPAYDGVEVASPEGVAALALWQELVRTGLLDLGRPGGAWEAGRAVFHLGSSARIRAAFGDLPFAFGVAPMPWARYRVTGVGGRNLAVLTPDSARQEAAWTFIRWMTGPEVNRRWSEATGYSPLRASTYRSAAYQEELRRDPRLAVALGEMLYARARPNIPAYAEVSRIVGEAVERALYRGGDPLEILEQASREAEQALRRYPAARP